MSPLWGLVFCLGSCSASFLAEPQKSEPKPQEAQGARCHHSIYVYNIKTTQFVNCAESPAYEKCPAQARNQSTNDNIDGMMCLFVSRYTSPSGNDTGRHLKADDLIIYQQTNALNTLHTNKEPKCGHRGGATICYCVVEMCNGWENIMTALESQSTDADAAFKSILRYKGILKYAFKNNDPSEKLGKPHDEYIWLNTKQVQGRLPKVIGDLDAIISLEKTSQQSISSSPTGKCTALPSTTLTPSTSPEGAKTSPHAPLNTGARSSSAPSSSTTTFPYKSSSSPEVNGSPVTTTDELLSCWNSDVSRDSKEKSRHVCFIDYRMADSSCEMRGRGIEQGDKSSTGCRIVQESKIGATLRCTCRTSECNEQLTQDIWTNIVSTNSDHLKLIECVSRMVRGDQAQTQAPSSSFPDVWHIASFILNALLVVTIIVLVFFLVKKCGGGKPDKGRKEQQNLVPTDIKVEKHMDNKIPLATNQTVTKAVEAKLPTSATLPPTKPAESKSAVQPEPDLDTTATAQENTDNNDATISLSSDSTGTEGTGQATITVRGFSNQ